MTFSGLISRSITTPNRSSRNGRRIDHVVLHHGATTNGQWMEDIMRTGSKEVSANYVQRSNGDLIGVVPEESRSWSLSSAEWDGRSITVETENESANGWTISAAASEKLARLVVDVAGRYGFPINRDTVLGHREVHSRHGASYATACPGGLDLDWIVARAQQVQAGGGGALPPVSTPSTPAAAAPSSGWNFWIPDAAMQARIQRALAARGRYAGPCDGDWGVESVRGIQRTIAQAGFYSGPIDGIAGAATCAGVQRYAAKFGDYQGPIDSALGINSWAGFALGLERP